MAISNIIDELEDLLMGATRVPLTNRRVLEEDDMIVLIDQLRDAIPEEIKEARAVLEMQKQILEDAQAEAEKIKQDAKYTADKIMNNANEYAAKATDEHEIIAEAQKRAEALLHKTQEEANDLHRDAEKYASDVFQYILGTLSNAMNAVEQARGSMRNDAK